MKKLILKKITYIAVALLLMISGAIAYSEQIATTSSDDHTLPSETSKCLVPTKIVLVRHGETSWNALGLLQGNADIPLNENGSIQAQALANSTYNKTVNAVYSSPLSRAYDTAQAVADVHQLPVKVRGNLREIGVGRIRRKNCSFHLFQEPYMRLSPHTAQAFDNPLNRAAVICHGLSFKL